MVITSDSCFTAVLRPSELILIRFFVNKMYCTSSFAHILWVSAEVGVEGNEQMNILGKTADLHLSL